MRDDRGMRTTLDIDDDVLQAGKEPASAYRVTAGQMLSELAARLSRFCASGGHVFWEDSASLLDANVFDWAEPLPGIGVHTFPPLVFGEGGERPSERPEPIGSQRAEIAEEPLGLVSAIDPSRPSSAAWSRRWRRVKIRARMTCRPHRT